MIFQDPEKAHVDLLWFQHSSNYTSLITSDITHFFCGHQGLCKIQAPYLRDLSECARPALLFVCRDVRLKIKLQECKNEEGGALIDSSPNNTARLSKKNK